MTQILVREPIESDQQAIADVSALATADLRKVYRPNQKALNNRDRISQSLTTLVATIGAAVVGTVEYRIEGDRLFLTALSVHPGHRRQGVAKALVAAAAKIARQSGIPCVALHTIKETGNVPIFERMDFRTVRESEDDFFESDTHSVLTNVSMEKIVSPERQ